MPTMNQAKHAALALLLFGGLVALANPVSAHAVTLCDSTGNNCLEVESEFAAIYCQEQDRDGDGFADVTRCDYSARGYHEAYNYLTADTLYGLVQLDADETLLCDDTDQDPIPTGSIGTSFQTFCQYEDHDVWSGCDDIDVEAQSRDSADRDIWDIHDRDQCAP